MMTMVEREFSVECKGPVGRMSGRWLDSPRRPKPIIEDTDIGTAVVAGTQLVGSSSCISMTGHTDSDIDRRRQMGIGIDKPEEQLVQLSLVSESELEPKRQKPRWWRTKTEKLNSNFKFIYI